MTSAHTNPQTPTQAHLSHSSTPTPSAVSASTQNTSAPASSTASSPLLAERASSIGWYFIESYYGFYNSNINSIHKVYSQNATLSHASFPHLEKRSLHQATGIESIKARFASDSNLKVNNNRIVITSADIQVCLQDKILIVVTGEWSKGDSPFWAFCQTFLLCPGKVENTLDLSNDILRFPGLQDYTTKPDVPVPVAAVAAAAPAASAVTTATAPATTAPATTAPAADPAAPVKAKQEEPDIDAEPVSEQTSETDVKKDEPATAATPSAVSAATPSTVSATASASASGSGASSEEPQEPAAPSALETAEIAEQPIQTEAEGEGEGATSGEGAPKLSWAALAATAASTAGAPAPETTTIATTAITAAKKPVKAVKESSADAPSSTSDTKPTGKYRKDEWFPIYIRGIREPITEDSLRKHLSAKFGAIKFLKVNIFIALCDFVDFESQQKALESKETTINGVTIQLEVRESKGAAPNGGSYNNGKYHNNNINNSNNNTGNAANGALVNGDAKDGGYIKVGPKGANTKDKKIKDKRLGGGVNDKKQNKKPVKNA